MNRIKNLRKNLGITQKQLADKLSVANSTLSYWEQGKYEPDHRNLFALADYFGVTTDYLLGKTDKPNADVKTIFITTEEFLATQGITNREHIESLKNLIDLAKANAEMDSEMDSASNSFLKKESPKKRTN